MSVEQIQFVDLKADSRVEFETKSGRTYRLNPIPDHDSLFRFTVEVEPEREGVPSKFLEAGIIGRAATERKVGRIAQGAPVEIIGHNEAGERLDFLTSPVVSIRFIEEE